MKPLAVDLFCGLGGWSEGCLAEGYRVVGFDIERHRYPMVKRPETAEKLPGNNGGGGAKIWSERPIARLKDAVDGLEVIEGEWAEYPAQLVLQDVLTIHGAQFKTADLIVASPPCQEYSYMAMPWSRAKQIEREYQEGVRDVAQLTALFDACFRIQAEASEAKGEHIPLVVENVRGAQKWVGRSRWNFGSFHLWGDVPALMPMAKAVKVPTMGAGWYPPEHPKHVPGLAFNTHAERNGRRTDVGNGARFTSRDCGVEGVKQHGSGREWFAGEGKISRITSSKSPERKAASAMIAKIPLVLSRHIARAWYPRQQEIA